MSTLEDLRNHTSLLYYEPHNIDLKKEIGQGGNSKVYHCSINNNEYAVKIYHLDLDCGYEDQIYELNVSEKLSNTKQIIKTYGYSYKMMDEYTCFMIIMELLTTEGDLYDYIQNSQWTSCRYTDINGKNELVPKPNSDYVYFNKSDNIHWCYNLSIQTKINITKSFANALSELYSKNIIHGDLKTNNLLIYHKNNTEHIKIIDLNTATRVKGESKDVIPINCKYGTEGYTAPEQYNFELHYKSDIYSWAVTIIEIWNGDIWYDNEGFKESRKEVLNGLRKIENNHPDFGKLLRKCISLDYHKRPYINTLLNKLNDISFYS